MNNVVNKPEYAYLDSAIVRIADKDSTKEVLDVLSKFILYRDKVVPNLNRYNYKNLVVQDLESIFDNTIMLAGGSESNFVKNHYKAILVQLAFQLGFLIERLLPETPYARYAKSKLNWLSTMDVRLETRMLQPFFNQNVTIMGDAPPIADTTRSSEVHFWDIDEIAFVLKNLTELGFKFKLYMEQG